MIFLLLASVLLRIPYRLCIGGWADGIKIASASTPPVNEPDKNLILVFHKVQLKPMMKSQISGRKVSSGICDVANASVYSLKICLKKFMMITINIIIMNISQEIMVFSGCQKLTSTVRLWPEN